MGLTCCTSTASSSSCERPIDALAFRSKTPVQDCPLIQIPIELRLKIYACIFTGSKIYIQALGDNLGAQILHKQGNDFGIALACRQTYHEARHEWYSSDLHIVGHLPCLRQMLCRTSPICLARIPHLTIHAHELPDLDTSLLPSLEELVINLTTDDTRQKNRKWCGLTDGDVYRFARSISIEAEHDTFMDYITNTWDHNPAFCVIVLIKAPAEKEMPPTDFLINLNTRTVERRQVKTLERGPRHVIEIYEHFYGPDGRPLVSRAAFQSLTIDEKEQRFTEAWRPKIPPGRERPERPAETGSIRDSEMDSSSEISEDNHTSDNDANA